MTETILVSTDGLSGLVGRLRTVAHELRAAGTGATGDGQTGDAGLEHALDAFHTSWNTKRHELADDVDKAALSLQNSLQSFTEADSALARAADGGCR